MGRALCARGRSVGGAPIGTAVRRPRALPSSGPVAHLRADRAASKVPEVTLGFWVIKILATTLGETGGDTVTMTMDLGYLTGTAIFLSVLVVLVVVQIAAKKFHPLLYWSVIVASTTAGTTLADFATRSWGSGIWVGRSCCSAA